MRFLKNKGSYKAFYECNMYVYSQDPYHVAAMCHTEVENQHIYPWGIFRCEEVAETDRVHGLMDCMLYELYDPSWYNW